MKDDSNEILAEVFKDLKARKCRGCGKTVYEIRYDTYGIPTGAWCEECYNSKKYPYRKDEYFDPGYANECLEPEE